MAQSQWIPQLDSQPGTGNSQSIIDLLDQNKIEQTPDTAAETKQYQDTLKGAAQSGLQAGQAGGGLGGTLTSAGASLGIGSLGAAEGTALAGAGPVGWGIMAGGLLLSAHEKKKQEEAAREQAKIQAEMTKRANLIQLARDSDNQDFRLV